MNYELKETILYLDNVELGYGEGDSYKPVLKNINIIERDVVIPGSTTGQMIAVIGRSGRGKSTLFKALTGLVKPKSGKVLITEIDSDIDGSAKEVTEGDVGFVDQKYTLFRHKTIEQIFKYALRKSDLSKAKVQEKINKYLVEWGLEKHRSKYPIELSGGQKQRVALVEQIMSSGNFMVLDEPISGLDLINIDDVKNSFELISNDHELNTIIFSSHDINFVVEMADSIYVVGYPEDTDEYSTIVKHYDLKEMGIAWTKFGTKHIELVNEIKEVFKKS